MPVLDRDMRLSGIITRKDVLPESIEQRVLCEENLAEIREVLHHHKEKRGAFTLPSLGGAGELTAAAIRSARSFILARETWLLQYSYWHSHTTY